MTEAEVIVVVKREIRTLSTNFGANDYADAVDEAERETGFTLPSTSSFQLLWLKQRTKRHLLASLLLGASEDFKIKQINANQKFEQLLKLVQNMDKEYEKALSDNPTEFANVSSYQLFGHKIDAGFAYEEGTGKDITYDPYQSVKIYPDETS